MILIHLLSQWANINPFLLLKNSFKGSGYDIACANAKGPISYQRKENLPQISRVTLDIPFKENCHFIYLGNKQFSDKEVTKYSELVFDRNKIKEEITSISLQLIEAKTESHFCELLELHENLLRKVLGYPTVKERLFSNIKGTFKSLGAWGGDFILFIGAPPELAKIKKLGYSTILKWDELLLIN